MRCWWREGGRGNGGGRVGLTETDCFTNLLRVRCREWVRHREYCIGCRYILWDGQVGVTGMRYTINPRMNTITITRICLKCVTLKFSIIFSSSCTFKLIG